MSGVNMPQQQNQGALGQLGNLAQTAKNIYDVKKGLTTKDPEPTQPTTTTPPPAQQPAPQAQPANSQAAIERRIKMSGQGAVGGY